MAQLSHQKRVLHLLRQKGMLRPNEVEATGIPRVVLTRMTDAGLIERVGRGLYRRPDGSAAEHDTLIAVATRVPQAVFSLLTALQFHELTTQLPRQVWISMPRGSHIPKMPYPPLRMVQVSGEAYSAGIEIVKQDGITLRVYSAAKTVADCFKHRNTIGLDVALEALRDARAQKKASADDLWRYAKVCRVANVMKPYLEAVA